MTQHKPRSRQRGRQKTPTKRLREKVEGLTAEGLNREIVAARTGVSIAKLRTDFAMELSAGRLQAKAAKAEAKTELLTKSERWILRNLVSVSKTHWWPASGCLLYLGTDGKCARTIADAFAAWRARGVVGSLENQSETPEEKAEAEKIYAEI
jgi:hypothetical protein